MPNSIYIIKAANLMRNFLLLALVFSTSVFADEKLLTCTYPYNDEVKESMLKYSSLYDESNFSFCEEKVEYITDQTRGYGSVPVAAYSQRQQALPKIRETIQDSRSCHFSLGLDKINYQSNTHAGFQGAAIDAKRAEGLERIKQMKKALQTTSIVIGDDSQYM